MPFGWGANPNPAGPSAPYRVTLASPMPFGWGANPNTLPSLFPPERRGGVTNAFRLGG